MKGVAMGQPFETIQVSDPREFLENLSPDGPIFGSRPLHTFASGNGKPTWVFRGQTDADRALLPSALREKQELLLTGGWKALATPISNADQAGAEYSSLQAFFWAADEHGLSLPEDSQKLRAFFDHSRNGLSTVRAERGAWLPDFLLSLAALAQHYGLPTRLLDWSYSPFVATYFAAGSHNSDAQHLCVWALDLSAIADIAALGSVLQSKRKARGFLRFVSAPRSGNQNLLAQDGLFTMYTPEPFDWSAPRVSTPVEGVVASWTGVRDMPILLKISLPRVEADNLRRLLLRRGITAAKLFPGYGGVVQDLRDRGRWGSGWGYQQDVHIPAYYPSLPSHALAGLRPNQRLQPPKAHRKTAGKRGARKRLRD